MCYPLFSDNPVSSALTNTSSFNMFNIQQNLAYESYNTTAVMHKMLNSGYGAYPIMSNACLNLPTGDAFLSGLKQSWDNYASNLKFNYNGFGGGGSVVGGGAGSASTNFDEKEYQSILSILKKIHDDGSAFDAGSDEYKEIENAINKTGTLEERLKAVKDVFKKYGNNEQVKKVAMQQAMSDKDIKAMLYDNGFNLTSGKYKLDDYTSDATHKSKGDLSDLAEKAIENLNNFNDKSGTDLTAVKKLFMGEESTNAVLNLTYLNQKINEDGGFVKVLTTKYASISDKDQKRQCKELMESVYSSMKNAADKVKNSGIAEGSLKSEFESAISTLENTYKEVTKDTITDTAKTNYINAFNKLYVMTKMIQAKEIDNKIKSKFGFLNKTTEGIIPENAIVNETKEMLKAEKVGDGESVDVSEVKGNSNSENSNSSTGASDLVTQVGEKITNVEGDLYKLNNNSYEVYYAKSGNDLIELLGVQSYNATTKKFKMYDNTEKTLKEVVSANQTNKCTKYTIEKDATFADKLSKYFSDNNISKTNYTGKYGEKVYKKSDNNALYITKDNKLYLMISNKNKEEALKAGAFECTTDNKVKNAKNIEITLKLVSLS